MGCSSSADSHGDSFISQAGGRRAASVPRSLANSPPFYGKNYEVRTDVDALDPSESRLNDFEAASHEVITFLHQRLGFALWMVTRVEDDNWIVLNKEDRHYKVKTGDLLRWSDSFCSRMIRGQGPRIAPDSDLVAVYASSPIRQQLPIKAYVGMPLTYDDGSLFGTLCAIDPEPQPKSICEESELIELQARLLSRILQLELKAEKEARKAERFREESMSDPLTGLYNRRGWEALVSAEEERCRRYGHPAAVLVVDLDDMKQVNDSLGHAAGDEYLRRAAQCLLEASRAEDVVARIGGDEFVLLGVECGSVGANALLRRVREFLQQAGVRASVGCGLRHPSRGLREAWTRADQEMYALKRSRDAVALVEPVRDREQNCAQTASLRGCVQER